MVAECRPMMKNIMKSPEETRFDETVRIAKNKFIEQSCSAKKII